LCYTFYTGLVRELARSHYVLDKTPTNVFRVEDIMRVLRKARLLCIFRDGRDVVVSEFFHLSRRGKRVAKFAEQVENWRDAVYTPREAAEHHDIHCIRFEDLRAQPDTMLVKVRDFLALDADKAIRADMLRRSSFEFITRRKADVEDRNSFYRAGSSGDWHKKLNVEQKQLFADVAGQALADLGYENSTNWQKWQSVDPPTALTR